MADTHEKILQKQLDKIAEEQKYEDYKIKITPISTEGANFTSKLFQATISAPNKEDLKLFAKVAALGDKFRQQMMFQIFDVENYTYNTLAKIYNEIQDKHQVPEEVRFRMPKIYAFDDTLLEETIVFEDLSALGYVTQDRMEAFSLQYARKSLEELAKWHALSIVFQEEYPEEYENAIKVLKIEQDMNQMLIGAIQQMTANTLKALKNDEHKKKLQKFLEESSNAEFMSQFVGPMKRPLLCHGDFRMSNIMHRPRGDELDLLILDYQAVHLGSGYRDVLFFLLSGTDEELRSKHFHELVDYYYENVALMLKRLNKEPEELFPREDFDYEVKANTPWAVILAVFALPMITVESENAPSVDKEFGLEDIVSVKTSNVYETRINGLISDFVNWGWL